MSWTDEYRAKVREFIEAKGKKVQVEEKRYEWQLDDEANVYGWTDYQAQEHEDHGVNVRGARCACGEYTDVILRWDGSVTDMLHTILGLPTSTNLEVEL